MYKRWWLWGFQAVRISLLAIKVAKASASFWCLDRGISLGGRPKSATYGEGSIVVLKFKALDIVLNMDYQKVSKVGQSQNMCINVAGACLHLSHIGSISGLILESLVLVQYILWINLSWMRLWREQMEEEWILCRTSDQSSSSNLQSKSVSHWSLTVRSPDDVELAIRAYRREVTPLLCGLVWKMLSRRVSAGSDGKPLKYFRTKSRIWKYLKRWLLESWKFSESWENEANVLPMYL